MATPKKKEYVLSEDQKNLILANFNKGVTNVDVLTALVAGTGKDGRSVEGIAVRKLLVENKLNFKTKTFSKREDVVELSEQQKEAIKKLMLEDKTSVQIAQEIFGAETKRLSKEWRIIHQFMLSINPDYRAEAAGIVATTYYAPKETKNKP
jgi:hypothetical protein